MDDEVTPLKGAPRGFSSVHRGRDPVGLPGIPGYTCLENSTSPVLPVLCGPETRVLLGRVGTWGATESPSLPLPVRVSSRRPPEFGVRYLLQPVVSDARPGRGLYEDRWRVVTRTCLGQRPPPSFPEGPPRGQEETSLGVSVVPSAGLHD